MTRQIHFDFSANPADEPGSDDSKIYDTRMKVARLGRDLGYEAAWVAEHHFTDYYTTPSPIMALAQIAAECPGLGLGTCVLVLPWYQPLRLASEIAMLTNMTDGKLMLGIGRGTAPLEHDAFGVPMVEAQGWFDDSLAIMRKAIAGGKFTYEGEHWSVTREVELRPRARAENVTFYGPYANPVSTRKYAAMDLPFLNAGYNDPEVQGASIKEWEKVTTEIGGDTETDRINWVPTIIAETDEEAYAIGREIMPKFFNLQREHYTVDSTRFNEIKGYESWQQMFAAFKTLSQPEILEQVLGYLFIGSPDTVARKVQRYIDMGYNRFVLHADMFAMPYAQMERSMTMFAKEVAPRFAEGFGDKKVAAE